MYKRQVPGPEIRQRERVPLGSLFWISRATPGGGKKRAREFLMLAPKEFSGVFPQSTMKRSECSLPDLLRLRVPHPLAVMAKPETIGRPQPLGERQWTVVGPLLDASPLSQESCSAPSVSSGPGPAAPGCLIHLNMSHMTWGGGREGALEMFSFIYILNVLKLLLIAIN